MKHLSWNCRGLGNPRAVRHLRDLVKSHNPTLLFLSETLVKKDVIAELSSKLGFADFFAVDVVGRSGGLAVLWKSVLNCRVIGSSANFVDVHILENSIPVWRLTCYYGLPDRERRHEAWEMLRQLARVDPLPWCIFGDFNDMLFASDKSGKHPHPQNLLDGFRSVIEDCELTEVELTGGEFTWEKSKGTPNWVRERLDRAFAENNWWQKFPLCKLTVTHTIYSDHDPIILELLDMSYSRKQFRFRFENIWLKEPSFHEEVSSYWQGIPTIFLLPKLISVSSFMAKWGRNFFHKFRDKVKKQKEILNALVNRSDEEGIRCYFTEKNRLDVLLKDEEFYWQQRAKAFWLSEGDTNSKFFHAYASARKKANRIHNLRNDQNEITGNHDEMCKMAEEYFQNVFAGGVGDNNFDQGYSGNGVITNEQNAMLTRELDFEEFSVAIKQMHPNKSAGPDGLNPAFFQHFWGLLGREVFDSCKSWLRECSFPPGLNNTTLVLIPKKENVESLSDVRPIALCNVLYKLLAKVLANRLKRILPVTISEQQSAFVPGRNITDNVLIAFEIIHYMRRKNKGLEGNVALKLDISKAYDRVGWNYLKHRMEYMGFDRKWISWMLLCVTTVEYKVCMNGTLVGPIAPGRGLRQGDPLSPYLFLLCVEGLSHKLMEAAANNEIHGCKINSHAPAVTHLLFADDSFLFFKANVEEAKAIKRLLDSYERLSGQAVNYQKSGIFFSANVRRDKQQAIMEELVVSKDLRESNYLGLPSLVGKSKKKVFNFLKERLWKRIQNWSNKILSKAGKTILIKNVAQSIPSYSMSCFLIPKSLCLEMERTMNSFWWTSNSDNRKGVKWMSWEKMCLPKCSGGLGFRSLHGFNMALIGKHIWNFIRHPSSLVARIFKARYFHDSSILQARKGNGGSFIWSGIWEAKEKLCNGYRWILGDGNSIKIFQDPWLRGKRNFRVEDHHRNTISDDKVCNYFRPNIKEWDVQKIEQTFHPDDVKCILQTRIPQIPVRDKIAWSLTNNGLYTVKSGYRHWQSSQRVVTEVNVAKGWKRIWKLEIPHKSRIFLWRFCKNNIPVRNLLRGKGINSPITCPMCNRDVEHILHLFFDCEFAKECWSKTDLTFDMRTVECGAEWLIKQVEYGVE